MLRRITATDARIALPVVESEGLLIHDDEVYTVQEGCHNLPALDRQECQRPQHLLRQAEGGVELGQHTTSPTKLEHPRHHHRTRRGTGSIEIGEEVANVITAIGISEQVEHLQLKHAGR